MSLYAEPYWKDEVVTFDPDDFDTYPSVCADPGEVQARFGFTGGEKFTHRRIEAWLDGTDRESPLTLNEGSQ